MLRHSLKLIAGWISKFASSGWATAEGTVGAALATFRGAAWRGVATAAVGCSAQATNTKRLEAAISWRTCQRRGKLEGILGSTGINRKVQTLTCRPSIRTPVWPKAVLI